MLRARILLSCVAALALFGCTEATFPVYRTNPPVVQTHAGDVLNDPVIAYRNGPGGFPIPDDAVAKGPSSFEVPRHYHQTARMQQAKLAELGFTIESSRPSGWAYKLHAKKGDKVFIATIATPRGPDYTESSTLDVVEE